MPTEYTCPRGCEKSAKGNKLKILTLQGWKSHMSRYHDTYTQTELDAAAGVSSQSNFDDLRREAESLQENVISKGAPSAQPGATPEPRPDVAPGPKVRTITGTPKKLRRLLTEIPMEFFKAKGITPDEEDREAVEESAKFLEEIFGVEFAVPESKKVVQNRFLALLWPVAVIVFVFFKHTIGKTMLESTEKKPEAKKD